MVEGGEEPVGPGPAGRDIPGGRHQIALQRPGDEILERHALMHRLEFGFAEDVVGDFEGRAHKRIFARHAVASSGG